MIRTKTVFVVGAGASAELDFPVGKKLLEEISEVLDVTYQHGIPRQGDGQIIEAIQRRIRDVGSDLGNLISGAARVRDAAELGISIDNIVHQLSGMEEIDFCAKIGIARRILDAEAKSALRYQQDGRVSGWPAVRGTWLGGFAQLLAQDMQRDNLEGIFENVSIICFNYDRTIRRFMPYALMSQFAIPEDQAQKLSAQLKIIHPYGSLGNLPWEGQKNVIDYGGGFTFPWLEYVAANIRTFTEQVHDEAAVSEIQSEIVNAERVVFLGFAYLPQNMRLLMGGGSGNARQVMGTAYGLSAPDIELVSGQLNSLFDPIFRPYHSAVLTDQKCAQFIQENFRTLSS